MEHLIIALIGYYSLIADFLLNANCVGLERKMMHFV